MSHPRHDFRPDKMPERIETRWFWTRSFGGDGAAGWKVAVVSARAATSHRRDHKDQHQTRQRQHNKKVIDQELRGLHHEGETEPLR